jgi:uncharacterized SAM-binding protein YcdF (DUF218 family)
MNQRIIKDITDFVFIEDTLHNADIIFIPGGSHPELGEAAAKLWKQGYAPFVMPSGKVSIKTGKFGGVKARKDIYNLDYQTDCEFLTDVLIKNGVKKEAIYQEAESATTKENAYFSRKVADINGLQIKKAILCCKCFHARRALMCYQFAFPETEFIVHPVPYYMNEVTISRDNWYLTPEGTTKVLGEMQRYGNQFNQEFLTLNESI